MTLTFVLKSFKVMSTIAASIYPKLLELETWYLVHGFVWRMPSGCTNNFPWKWVWPRSRGLYNFNWFHRCAQACTQITSVVIVIRRLFMSVGER